MCVVVRINYCGKINITVIHWSLKCVQNCKCMMIHLNEWQTALSCIHGLYKWIVLALVSAIMLLHLTWSQIDTNICSMLQKHNLHFLLLQTWFILKLWTGNRIFILSGMWKIASLYCEASPTPHKKFRTGCHCSIFVCLQATRVFSSWSFQSWKKNHNYNTSITTLM